MSVAWKLFSILDITKVLVPKYLSCDEDAIDPKTLGQLLLGSIEKNNLQMVNLLIQDLKVGVTTASVQLEDGRPTTFLIAAVAQEISAAE